MTPAATTRAAVVSRIQLMWEVYTQARKMTLGAELLRRLSEVPGILAGRDFAASDRRDAPFVVIVNQAFARAFFGGDDAQVVALFVAVPSFTERHDIV